MHLPPYSPELNPIERLWKYVKDKHFTQWYTDSREALQDRIADALLDVMEHQDVVRSVCRV